MMSRMGVKLKLLTLLVIQFFLFSNLSWSYPSKEEIIDKGNNLAVGNLIPGNIVTPVEFYKKAEEITVERADEFASGSEFKRTLKLKKEDKSKSLKDIFDREMIDKSTGVERPVKIKDRIKELAAGYYEVNIVFQGDNEVEINIKIRGEKDVLVHISLVRKGDKINLIADGKTRPDVFYFKNIIENYLGDNSGYLENSLPVSKELFRYPAENDLDVHKVTISLEELLSDEEKGKQVIESWKKDPKLKKDEQGRPIAPLAFLFLNGGLGSRMRLPIPKGHVDLLERLYGNEDINMVEMHIRMAKALEVKYGIRFHIYIINSNVTDSANIELLQKKGLMDKYVHLYSAGLSKRRALTNDEIDLDFGKGSEKATAYREFLKIIGVEPGDYLPESVLGDDALGSTGHMEAMICGILTGAVEDMIRNGIQYVNQANIQHVITHDFLPQMLGRMVKGQKKDPGLTTVLHFRLVDKGSKPGGGLFRDKKTGKIIMLEDSVLDKELKYTSLKEKMRVIAGKEGTVGVSTANYVYDVRNVLKNLGLWNYYERVLKSPGETIDYRSLRVAFDKKVSKLAVINPTKDKAIKVRTLGKEIPASIVAAFSVEKNGVKDSEQMRVPFKQSERQIQDMITYMPTEYIAAGSYRACSIKDGMDDIRNVARNILLTNLPYLQNGQGFLEGQIDIVKSKLEKKGATQVAQILEKDLEQAYNLLLRMMIGSTKEMNRAMVLKLNKEEIHNLVGVKNGGLYFKKINPVFLAVFMMRTIISQVGDYSFDLALQIPSSDRDDRLVGLFTKNINKLLLAYGIKGSFQIIDENTKFKERVEADTKGKVFDRKKRALEEKYKKEPEKLKEEIGKLSEKTSKIKISLIEVQSVDGLTLGSLYESYKKGIEEETVVVARDEQGNETNQKATKVYASLGELQEKIGELDKKVSSHKTEYLSDALMKVTSRGIREMLVIAPAIPVFVAPKAMPDPANKDATRFKNPKEFKLDLDNLEFRLAGGRVVPVLTTKVQEDPELMAFTEILTRDMQILFDKKFIRAKDFEEPLLVALGKKANTLGKYVSLTGDRLGYFMEQAHASGLPIPSKGTMYYQEDLLNKPDFERARIFIVIKELLRRKVDFLGLQAQYDDARILTEQVLTYAMLHPEDRDFGLLKESFVALYKTEILLNSFPCPQTRGSNVFYDNLIDRFVKDLSGKHVFDMQNHKINLQTNMFEFLDFMAGALNGRANLRAALHTNEVTGLLTTDYRRIDPVLIERIDINAQIKDMVDDAA